MAKLVVLTEGFAGKTCELTNERTTIGRLDDNLFPIPEPSVSSHHCEVTLRGTEVLIKDLNSTNGTFINGEPIKEGVLKSGQTLRLGQVELRLENGKVVAPGTNPAKKHLDHTMPIPGGVKLNEHEQGTHAAGSPFAKKSNKANKAFLYGGLALGAVIIVLIAYSIWQIQNR
jgi:pSer/pThr/pTyr-binding forkhead associated (FHA) protein